MTAPDHGTPCPRCGCRHVPVRNTRHINTGRGIAIKRYRVCAACARAFCTIERRVDLDVPDAAHRRTDSE